jgi:hypothetical protein
MKTTDKLHLRFLFSDRIILLNWSVFFYKTTFDRQMHARMLERKIQFPFYSILYQLLLYFCLDSTFSNSMVMAVYFMNTMLQGDVYKKVPGENRFLNTGCL